MPLLLDKYRERYEEIERKNIGRRGHIKFLPFNKIICKMMEKCAKIKVEI